MKQLFFIPCALAILLIGGCNLLTNKQPTQKTAASTLPSKQAEKTRPFTKDSLSELLIAEFAERRGDFQKTLNIYTLQAKKTKDPNVTERAYQIAAYLNDRAERLDMAVVWVNVAPNNIAANRAAFFELSQNGMANDTEPYLEKILTQTKALDFLDLESNPLSAESYSQLILHIDQLQTKYPNNNQITYTKAVLLSKNKESQEALATLDKLPRTIQQQNEVILLKAYLLQDTGKSNEALALLNKEIQNTPQNKQLRLSLAHRFINEGKLQEAKQQFSILNKQYPNDEDIRFALVLICLETSEWDEAINHLNIMLEHGVDPNIVYFYLASAYDKKGDKAKALNYYQQVNESENLLKATASVARILFEQNKIKEAQQFLVKARQNKPALSTPLYLFEVEELQTINKLPQAWLVINQAIKADPKNTHLYYSRALLAENSHNIAQAEKDLRYIIKLEPNNDTAINALGYILADKTTRYKEALQLIKQALALNPESPATLDSMGWVCYKLGKLEEAHTYLQQAYDNYPAPDVAAHLGEVLWKQNNKEQAKTIWSKALAESPSNTLLLETIKRLTGSKEL